jgi:hypothetical protein
VYWTKEHAVPSSCGVENTVTTLVMKVNTVTIPTVQVRYLIAGER